MNEVIVFADTEALLVTYLKGILPSTPVSTQVPAKNRPDRFVKVTRIGGTKIRLNAEAAHILVECWDKNSVDAFELCRLARAYIDSLEGDWLGNVWVYRVEEIGGPAFLPDPSTTLPRYQFTVSLELKGGKL